MPVVCSSQNRAQLAISFGEVPNTATDGRRLVHDVKYSIRHICPTRWRRQPP